MELCCKATSILSITLILHILHLLTLSKCQSGGDDSELSPAVNRNCTTSFTVLEEDMLSHEQNRYNLLKTFYPPRGALPVFVTVTYTFGDTRNQSVWFWSEAELYLIQPIDVLQYTSLFHSNFNYREGKLDLRLTKDCAETRSEFMELLTQRLKLYAQAERVSITSNPLRISDLYTAVAASREEIASDKFQSQFSSIWIHIALIIFPIATVLVIHTCDPIHLLLGEKTRQKLRDETNHPHMAAIVQISVLFTIFVFVLDCFAFVSTLRSDLYSDPTRTGFYLTTVTGVIIDLAAMVWVIFVLVSSLHSDCRHISKGRFCEPVKATKIHSLFVSVTVSPLLCLANHLPYILFSFVSDPHHAGSILIAYFLTSLLFYFLFRQFYAHMVLRTASPPKNFPHALNPDLVHYPDGDACRRRIGTPFNTRVIMLSLVIVTPLVIFYEGLIVVLFRALPITKTIEDSPTRLYTIYQGTGILIASLLTYNIILRPVPFSLSRTFETLGKQLHIPEKLGRKWLRMGDEEKAAVVIRTLYVLTPPTGDGEINNTAISPDGGGAYHQGYESTAMEELNHHNKKLMKNDEKEEKELQEVTLEMETTVFDHEL